MTEPEGTEQVKPDPPEEDSARQDRPGDELSTSTVKGVSTAVPPWQRAGTSMAEEAPSPATLQVAPEQVRDAAQTKDVQPRPIGRAYGFSSDSGAGSVTGPTRYGRTVAQPLSGQSSRGPDLSPPTVRIGGRVQTEPAGSPQHASPRARSTRIPRRTTLQLRYLEPWSVLKVSLVLSVAGFLAWMLAVGLLYSVLAGMGVWDQLNGTYSDLTSVSDRGGGQELISAGGVFGVAALIGLVNIVLITAMCTVGAFIYNASADLAGGIEVTLSERD
ncbi:MAG TPA: DUF3566 domain-containing protein [Pseudonocardiaceae bacterium]|nr:DUF3566 domain-containing protein [Pseudonocardiaceae bacterium]